MTDKVNHISQENLKELLELYETARNTPVITFSVSEPSFADKAWDKVREFQEELGKKYDYDWHKVAINGKGEIIPI